MTTMFIQTGTTFENTETMNTLRDLYGGILNNASVAANNSKKAICTISNCISTGTILGEGAGGICGYKVTEALWGGKHFLQ